MKSIVINADDFGYSDGICRSIYELIDIDAVSGTSLMCASHGARERFQTWNARDLLGRAGVHLQLTGGKPVSPEGEVPALIDQSSGDFRNPRSGHLPNLEEVEIEWRRQIEVAVDILGGLPTHLDSHHGVHRIPELFPLYVALGTELGIPVRGAGGEIGTMILDANLRATVAVVREWTGKWLGPAVLRDMIRQAISENPEEDFIEVVTHPGYNDEYLTSVSSLSEAREGDHTTLAELHRMGWPEIDGYRLGRHAEFQRASRT